MASSKRGTITAAKSNIITQWIFTKRTSNTHMREIGFVLVMVKPSLYSGAQAR